MFLAFNLSLQTRHSDQAFKLTHHNLINLTKLLLLEVKLDDFDQKVAFFAAGLDAEILFLVLLIFVGKFVVNFDVKCLRMPEAERDHLFEVVHQV